MQRIIKGLDGHARSNEHATERVYGPRWQSKAILLILGSLMDVIALFGWFLLIFGDLDRDVRSIVLVFTVLFSLLGLFQLYVLFHVRVILTPDFVIVRDLIERRVRRSEVSAFEVIQHPVGEAFRLHCGPGGNKRMNVPAHKFDSEWFAWLNTVKCLNPGARTGFFSKTTLLAIGAGSGDTSADEQLITRIIRAFNYLYSINVQPGDFSVKFGGRDDIPNSFVLTVKVPTPATQQVGPLGATLGEEMAAALEELLRRNGLR
jgi:hypothetical protein